MVEALADRPSEAAAFLEKAISLGGPKYAQMAKREEAFRRLPLEVQAQTPGFKSQIPGKLQ